MFGRNPKKEDILRDAVITRILTDMETYGPDAPEFPDLLSHLERINTLRSGQKRKVSPDTMAIVVGNLMGILIIVAYEQKHVMVSKAQSLLLKTR